MHIAGLGYIGLGVSDVNAWHDYATDFLGAQATTREDGSLRLRVDQRDWRIAIHPDPKDDILYAGWELTGPEALAGLVDRLREHGVSVEVDDELAHARGVLGLARCQDPAGTTCEFYWGPTEKFEHPFISPTGTRFETGSQGLGHIVFASNDLEGLARFYQEILGFRLSDRIDMPVAPGVSIPVFFLHCNPRHHSFAYAPAMPGDPKVLVHFMLQASEFDDVGFALDRLERQGVELASTLGRHSNDHMVSFYAVTPSGFEVEYGWGARMVDDANWTAVRHERTSAWGHRNVRARANPGAAA